MRVYLYLIFLHLFATVWGINAGLTDDKTPLTFLLSLTFAILIVMACARDGVLRGKPIVGVAKLLMVATWPVTVPIYLMKSRGWRGLLWAILWAVTLYVSFAVPAAGIYYFRTHHR